MSAAISQRSWPRIVWDVPMLRGLDARGRSEIEAAGSLRRLRAGEVLFAPNDPADAIHVVTSGVVALSGVRRGDDATVVLRRARAGEVLGEEAIVAAFAVRHLEARCESDAVVAVAPVAILERAASRAGGADLLGKVQRALRRAATLDLLRTTSFTRGLAEGDLEILLDAARHVHVPRGEHVYREGDVATDAFLVADGLLQAQTTEDGRPRIEGYLARGDVFGEEELADRAPRAVAIVASGPTWLVAVPRDVFVPIARRNPDLAAGARRLRAESAPRTASHTTHLFQDLYRLRVARSLLVIDQDSCMRCGHCAWSCADVHDDGVSRLVRRGDKIVAGENAAPLLVPNSCQHCKNPSCMIGCPTGAIGRDARGEVFIREELCTGCGSCAKACPWDNIQLAPRGGHGYPAVAVKCDLCSGSANGPACVAGCPTQAIARIDPSAALVQLRIPRKKASALVLPPRIPAWPWILGSVFAAMGLAALPLGRWTTGVVGGAAILALAAYSALKRRMVPKLRTKRPIARALYIAHLGVGAVACGALAAHVGGRLPSNAAGALAVSVIAVVLSGAAGAALVAWLPRMLSRIERASVLPEELADRPAAIDEKIFASLSGRSELLKTLFAKALRPYRASRVGPIHLVLSGRTLREEERAVRQRLDALTGGKQGPSLAGLDDLVRLVVEHRAVRAQRVLTWLLRGWLVPHVASSAAAIVLVVVHVLVVVTRAR